MKKSLIKQLALLVAKFINVAAVTAILVLCWQLFYADSLGVTEPVRYVLAIGVIYFMAFIVLGRVYDVFAIGSNRISQIVYSQSLTMLILAVAFYFVMSLLTFTLLDVVPLLIALVVQFVWCVLWSYLVNRLYYCVSPPRYTAIIYQDESELKKLEEIRNFKSKFKVEKYIRCDEDIDVVLEEIADAEVVFVTKLDIDKRNEVCKYCIETDKQCYILPRVGDVILAGADNMHTFSVPFMRVKRSSPNLEYLFLKRAFDIVASLLAIILLSPFMLITALAIKLYDGGPVLYKQVRLTKNYREFNVLKFRSMRTDAEKDGVARLSTEHDDRITPIGKLIRKIRFDELPQLFNILKGDMTIVGPRPERPEIAVQYEDEIPSFGLRLQVKAGLTGYAQVYGRYNTEPYDKLKMDLMYINNMSIWEDLRLIFATVKILFVPESTAGIADGQTTASTSEVAEEEASSVEEKV